jgi:NADH dehydrogenase
MLPLVGADTRFQPVYVDDLAAAAERGVLGGAEPGIYEIGGPEVMTFRELMSEMLGVIRRRRMILSIPFWLGRIMGWGFDLLNTISAGLIKGPITLDQVRSLKSDNVVGEGARGLSDLGIQPTPMDAILESYLWRFRPSGQYSEIKESAKNLKA